MLHKRFYRKWILKNVYWSPLVHTVPVHKYTHDKRNQKKAKCCGFKSGLNREFVTEVMKLQLHHSSLASAKLKAIP